MDLAQIIATVAAGIAGASAASFSFEDKSLGRRTNGLSGLAGGFLGTLTIDVVLGQTPGTAGLIQTIAGAGLGGAFLLLVVGSLRRP